jgi:hypothetical protein
MARPRKKFDLGQVQLFGQMGLSGREMAALLRTTPETISHRMTERSSFFKAYELGLSTLKKSLRHAQIKSALGGNPSLLIWLGKQLLDQHEQPMVNVSATAISNSPVQIAEETKAELARVYNAVRERVETRRQSNNDALLP